MSYALSAPLQAAVFGALSADAGVAAVVGTAIYDQAPPGAIAGTYVSLGEEVVKDASDESVAGAIHEFAITVVTDVPGFAQAKAAAGAVCDALIGPPLTLSRGRLVGLQFLGARAVRTRADSRRRIDLRFRARLEDS